jgi:hypothetical protein
MFGILVRLAHSLWHTPELFCPWIIIGVAIAWMSLVVWGDHFNEYRKPCYRVKWSHILFPFHLNNVLPVWWNPPINVLFTSGRNYIGGDNIILGGLYIMMTVIIWPVRLLFNLLVLLLQVIVVRLDRTESLLTNL